MSFFMEWTGDLKTVINKRGLGWTLLGTASLISSLVVSCLLIGHCLFSCGASEPRSSKSRDGELLVKEREREVRTSQRRGQGRGPVPGTDKSGDSFVRSLPYAHGCQCRGWVERESRHHLDTLGRYWSGAGTYMGRTTSPWVVIFKKGGGLIRVVGFLNDNKELEILFFSF